MAAAFVSALVALIAARAVLSHGSGTYVALRVFLPLLVLPGALVWWSPRSAYIAVWSLAGLFTTMVWSIAGTPYHYERELASWTYINTPVSIAITIVAFGTPLLAVIASNRIAPPPEREPLAQRLRRIVMLVFVVATIVAMSSFLLFGAEGVVVAVYTAALIAPGLAVQVFPRPLTAWLWTGLCAPLAMLGIWLWPAFHTLPHGLARVIEAGIGMIHALVLVALPWLCITAHKRSVMDNSARASYRRSRQTSPRTPHPEPGAARSR